MSPHGRRGRRSRARLAEVVHAFAGAVRRLVATPKESDILAGRFPPRDEPEDDAGPAGSRVPRRPIVPAGSASAALVEPEDPDQTPAL